MRQETAIHTRDDVQLGCLETSSTMTDYTGAIYGLIGLGVVLTVGVVFVLAQPTDLPVLKKDKRQN